MSQAPPRHESSLVHSVRVSDVGGITIVRLDDEVSG